MNLNKVYEALRKGVKLAKEHPDAFTMGVLVETADNSLTAIGGFAYFLALAHGADNELMIVRDIEDGNQKSKTLIHPMEYLEKKFRFKDLKRSKDKRVDVEDLYFRSRWPKEFLFRYYDSEEFSDERVQILADVVEFWISNEGKFPKS
jgi:hypothetical protein